MGEGLFSVRESVVLVTGSTRGLGRALARGFAEAGATVLVNGRTEEAASRSAAEISREGGRALPLAFDVRDPEAVGAAIGRAEREIAPLDCLVNCAGVHRRAPLEEMTDEEWRDVLETDLTSVFTVSRAAVGGMIARGRGRIINIASLCSFGARPTIGNYCAAKGGVKMLTQSMATEWGGRGIRANAIAPGYFVTDLTRELASRPEFDSWVRSEVPLGRWGKPEELVGAAIFLASPASEYVNGHVLVVDGGWMACL